MSTQDDWRTGYCNTVKVTNNGTAPLTWRVSISVEGTINNAWNATYTLSGSQVSFVGDDWNAQLAPGASTSFGYCAGR